MFRGKQIELELWDTAGQEDFDRLRPLSYPETDVVLICFSINSKDSFTNVFEKWAPEVKHFCENIPIILVGTKKDLRDGYVRDNGFEGPLKNVATQEMISETSKNESMLSFNDGCLAADQLNAFAYCECSSKFNDGVRHVFDMALEASLLDKKSGKKFSCNLL